MVFFSLTNDAPALIIFHSTTTWATEVLNTRSFSCMFRLHERVFNTSAAYVFVEITIIKGETSFVSRSLIIVISTNTQAAEVLNTRACSLNIPLNDRVFNTSVAHVVVE